MSSDSTMSAIIRAERLGKRYLISPSREREPTGPA